MATEQERNFPAVRMARRVARISAAITIFIFAVVSWGCGSESSQHVADAKLPLSKRIGWLHGPCLAISNPSLAHGTPVALIMTVQPQRVISARILEQTSSPSTCPALIEGRREMNSKDGTSFYKLETGGISPTDMGLGIVSPPANIVVADGLARAALDRNGHSEVFSSCATSEGIRFAVWDDTAYQGMPRWSGYYYLDYDTNPTCP
jgi:hypothetical protein